MDRPKDRQGSKKTDRHFGIYIYTDGQKGSWGIYISDKDIYICRR